jgi:hypothetical protein
MTRLMQPSSLKKLSGKGSSPIRAEGGSSTLYPGGLAKAVVTGLRAAERIVKLEEAANAPATQPYPQLHDGPA